MKIIRYIICLLAIAGIFSECKKDHGVLGIDVQPKEDQLGAQFLSNIPVYGHTIGYDSITSYNTGIKYLGSNTDPYFGKLDIGLCLNSNMSVANLVFDSTSFITSAEIVLALGNTDYAGDKNAALTFSVYTLDSVLVPTRAYYSNNYRLYNKNNLLCKSTSTYIEAASGPVLRIPIDSLYASKILKYPQFLTDNATFQNTYRGFYIAASSPAGEGVIFNCDLEHPASGFFLHYRNGKAPTDSVQDFQFLFSGASSSKFNTVKFSPAPPLSNQMAGDTALGNDALYLKGMGATRLKIQIPFLRNISDSISIAVNRAEVIFQIDPSFPLGSGRYNVPLKMSLLPMDSLGREMLSIDQSNTINITRYDGNYDPVNNRYVFNIPLHAQAILKGSRKNYGFYLLVADPLPPYTIRRDNYLDRVILAGSNKTLKPVLNLSYTPLHK